MILLVAQTVGNLYLPNLNADIINNGVITGKLHYILSTGLVMIAITVLVGVFAVVAVYYASRIGMGAGADIREAVFTRVQSFSARDMNHFGTASLITRNTNDIQQIQLFLQMALTMMVIAPIMCVGGIILAIHEGAQLSTLLLVAVPVMAVFIGIVMVKVIPQFRSMQRKIDRINEVLREQITGVRVIRAFVRNDAEAERFSVANADLTNTALRVNRVFALMLPTMMMILNLSSVAVLWFGGRLVSEGSMPIGNLTAFLTYILQILLSVMMAVMVAILLPRAAASAERVQEVLLTVPVVSDPPTPVRPAAATGVVSFDGVSFMRVRTARDDDAAGLAELDHDRVLDRPQVPWWDPGSDRSVSPDTDHVLVNGVDVREQAQESLWASLGIVPQAAYLFSGTVASNLRFGRPAATDEELWHALEIAQAKEFVAAMPGALEAAIYQGGTNVSGGQRQRLSIARALVKKPSVYLFDDCFSALDAATDARLRVALKEGTSDASVVIVAQRVSTIMQAERIIVLDDGKVVGSGTHRELVKSCSPYREIVVSQLGEGAAT